MLQLPPEGSEDSLAAAPGVAGRSRQGSLPQDQWGFRGLSQGQGHAQHIGKVHEFKRLIQAVEHASDRGLPLGENVTNFGRVKLLIGVLSAPKERDYRDVHRTTWMSRIAPRVCPVNLRTTKPEDGCSIFSTFVLGNTGDADLDDGLEAEDWANGDITRVTSENGKYVAESGGSPYRNFNLNMKVFHWLRLASERFKWATHVAQADMDSRPYPGMLANLLNVAQGFEHGAQNKQWSSLWADS